MDRRLLRFEDPLYKTLLMTPCPSAIDASVEVGRRLDILVPKQLLYDLEAAGRGIEHDPGAAKQSCGSEGGTPTQQ